MKTKRFKVSNCYSLLGMNELLDVSCTFLFSSLMSPALSHWSFSTLKLASTPCFAYPGC